MLLGKVKINHHLHKNIIMPTLIFIALWWTQYIEPENWPSQNQLDCYNYLLNNSLCGDISHESHDVTFKCMYAIQITCTFIGKKE